RQRARKSLYLGTVRGGDVPRRSLFARRRRGPRCRALFRFRTLAATWNPVMTLAQDAPSNKDDPRTWGKFNPLIIAHDVGSGRDRSTAVVGGTGPFQPRLLGILEVNELPQKLYGSARASALAQIDQRYQRKALIVADLSHDPTYAEVLY